MRTGAEQVFQIFSKKASRSRAALRVGFVALDPQAGAQFRSQIAERDNIDLKLVPSASVTREAPPRDVNVLVYDLDPTSEKSLADFDRFMGLRPADIPVIVLSPAVDDELVRWFLRLRVADWVKMPLSKGELIAACGRVLSQQIASRQDLRCLTFIGARGGVGATTIAMHAAMALNREAAIGKPALLVDLDLAGGSCADYLDVTAGWQVDELAGDPGRLDDHMLETMAVTHASGLPILSAHRNYFAAADLPEEVITRALDLASRKYASLVIDMPRHWEPWVEGVLAGSTEIYIVTDSTVPGLKAAKRIHGELVKELEPSVAPKIIVNKCGGGLFSAGVSAAEVKKLLGPALAGIVPNEEKLVREAIDRGIPTTDIKSRNSIIREVSRILEKQE